MLAIMKEPIPQRKIVEVKIMEQMLAEWRVKIRDRILAGAAVERGPYRAFVRKGKLVIR